ncbi:MULTISPECIES: choice-of-anchor tandem repeat GloVer-containing protein [Cupriavidus]
MSKHRIPRRAGRLQRRAPASSAPRALPFALPLALSLALLGAAHAQAATMQPVVLYSFTATGGTGGTPLTPPVYRDGKVYGVASRSGSGGVNNPVAYSVSAAGGGFAGQSFPTAFGISPQTNLPADSQGNLYGGYAGSPFTVYRLPAGSLVPVALDTSGLTLGTGLKGIWSVDRNAGSASRDALYFAGTASDTLSLFRLAADGTRAAIKTFAKYDSAPSALLATSDGWLYGVTGAYFAGMFGGTKGYVYRIRPDDPASFEIMKPFDATTGYAAVNNTSVAFSGLVEGKDGWLYGTTYASTAGTFAGDADDGLGVAYRISKTKDAGGFAFETLHTFGGAGDGTHAGGPLALGDDGNVYGTTYKGGDSGNGTLYRIVTANAGQAGGGYEKLASFDGAASGKLPNGVTLGADHKLYGTASGGGAGTAGTVFQVDIGYVAPVAAAIAAFTASPTAVTLGSDGKPSGSTTLAWQADHATACTASGAWSGAKQTSGSEALLPAIEGANAYTLTCSGAGGDATATVTVTATRAPATGGGTTPAAPAGGTPASDGGGGGPLGPLALLAAGAALLARRRR